MPAAWPSGPRADRTTDPTGARGLAFDRLPTCVRGWRAKPHRTAPATPHSRGVVVIGGHVCPAIRGIKADLYYALHGCSCAAPMKIVLSRKGFDSSNGGVPSPVLPDGTVVPLPIPAHRGPTRFRGVRWGDGSLGTLVEDLTGSRVRRDYRCHLDPDLQMGTLPRRPGWRPAFGQVDIAQRHLAREGVGPGDLFLFFGWFRPAEHVAGGGWRYVRHTSSVHRLFGWLQVSEVVPVGTDMVGARAARPWLSDHPHVNGQWSPSNTIYVATQVLSIGGTRIPAHGGGLFSGSDDRLMLTAPEATSRSYWRLPGWFWSGNRPPSLSYHRDEERWRRAGGWAFVKSVGRGQEFVIDADGIPEADAWLHSLFES